jgi:hypothetical protein
LLSSGWVRNKETPKSNCCNPSGQGRREDFCFFNISLRHYEREAILKRFSEAYQVQFLLYTARGEKVAGEAMSLPPAVLAAITAPPRGAPPPELPPPDGRGRMRPPPFPMVEVETRNPTLYWKLVRKRE